MPAGKDWQRVRRTDVADGIAAVDVQCRDPDKTAARWGEIFALDVSGCDLGLDNANISFREGAVDSLVGVTLTATERSRAGETRTLCGVRFTLR